MGSPCLAVPSAPLAFAVVLFYFIFSAFPILPSLANVITTINVR